MNKPSACLLLIWLAAGFDSALAAPVDCSVHMQEYHTKYGDDAHNGKSTYHARLAYLESINSPSCQSNVFYQTSKTGLLVLLGRVSEAMQCIDDADRRGLRPRQYVLESKATTLLLIKKYDVIKVAQSLDDIGALFQEALRIENKEGSASRFPIYYAGLAEVALRKGNFDEAEKLIKIAIELDSDSPSQYYSLAGVVASRQKRWNQALQFLEMSIKKNKDNYLSEDETIRALAEAFCNIGRNDLAAKAVSLAISEHPIIARAPDIVEAQRVVNNCTVAKSSMNKGLTSQ